MDVLMYMQPGMVGSVDTASYLAQQPVIPWLSRGSAIVLQPLSHRGSNSM